MTKVRWNLSAINSPKKDVIKKKRERPEEVLCIQLMNLLCHTSRDWDRDFFITHVPNEVPGGMVPGHKYAYIAKQKSMGMVGGTPDYFVISDEARAIGIEIKVPGGDPYKKLSPEQKKVRTHFKRLNIPFLVHNNIADAIESIRIHTQGLASDA